MTVKYSRQIDGEPAAVAPIELFQESEQDQQHRRSAEWALRANLTHPDGAGLLVQELNVSENVLREHSYFRADLYKPTEWPSVRCELRPSRYHVLQSEREELEMEAREEKIFGWDPKNESFVLYDKETCTVAKYRLIPPMYHQLMGDREPWDGNSYIPYGGEMILDEGQAFEWTEDDYKDEYQRDVRTGLYSGGNTHVAIVPVERNGFGRELFGMYQDGARYDVTNEKDYWTPHPTLDDYEPFPEPKKLDRDEYSAVERFDAWFLGGHPHRQRMRNYYQMEGRLRQAYLDRQEKRLIREHEAEIAARDAKRREDNPLGLIGFTEIVVTPDEVFDEGGELKPSDKVMLYFISGYTVIVKEPGQPKRGLRGILTRAKEKVTMLIPLKRELAEQLQVEEEI